MTWSRLILLWTTLLALALAPASATARASVIAKTHVGVIDVAANLCIEAASSASLGEYRENPLAEYDGTSDVPHAAKGARRAGHNGVQGPLRQTSHTTRSGGRAVTQKFPDGSVKSISEKRVKEFVPNDHPKAPPGTSQKVKFENAQPGSKGYKRDPTPQELEELQ